MRSFQNAGWIILPIFDIIKKDNLSQSFRNLTLAMEETDVMRNIFSSLPTEKVKIIKQDLSIIDGVDALVQSTMVFIQDGSINIEEGDTIERLLPSGAKEQFLVVDRGFL